METDNTQKLADLGGNYSYLTRCVAIVSLLMERGILDELLESGRISREEVDRRVAVLEEHYPGFKVLGVDIGSEENT